MRRLCLIVNPHAGGGRTAGALPGVQDALRDRGHELRTETTLSLEHAITLATAAAQAGEVAVSFGGDGLAGACAHALRRTGGVLGVLPGGRGNDFARKLGIPREPLAACAVLSDGSERTVDVGEVDGRTFLGIASYGFDSAVQDLANASRVKGQLVYVYATLRAMARWQRARLTWSADGATERAVTGYAVAACNSGVFGGGMALAPDADMEDGLLDMVISGEKSKLGYLWNLPRVVQGHARQRQGRRGVPGPRGGRRRRATVPDLRRRRPDRRHPCDDPRRPRRADGAGAVMRLAATVARAAGALSRRTGRGGTSLPGKVLLRMEPRAIRDLAARLPNGSAVISATNGKTTTAAMVAAILERSGTRLVHNRAGANMAGGVASALLIGRGDTGLFEVDEFWLDRVVPDLQPRAILLANLFRDQLDRYGELETIADRWAEVVRTTDTPLVLNADDPTIADFRQRGQTPHLS